MKAQGNGLNGGNQDLNIQLTQEIHVITSMILVFIIAIKNIVTKMIEINASRRKIRSLPHVFEELGKGALSLVRLIP